MEDNVYRTSCPRDCFGGCSMRVYVQDGNIVRLEGDESNRATGGKLCAKGMAYIDYVYSPNRVKYPMIRKGNRGSGGFQRISWDEAIHIIGDKMEEIKSAYGPESLMYFSSGGCQGLLSEYYQGFFSQYGGYTTTRGNLCYSAGIEATRLTYGEVKHNAPWDIENAGLIILWGKNPAFTNVQEMKLINNAISNGAKLITIDPIKNPAYKRSHLHISPMPGTDAALALSIINIMINHKTLDMEFINSYTHGFDELKHHVDSYTPDRVGAFCGVDEDEIFALAELIEKNRPMTLVCGYGLQRYKNGGQTVRAVSMIPAVTGNVGIRGGGFRFANKQIKLKWPYMDKGPLRVRDDYPSSLLARAVMEHKNPDIKMLWIERANPMVMNPDTQSMKKSMEKPDLIVVAEQFFTDTTAYADIVLPAQSFFEYDDIFTGYWTPYLNYTKKIISPYYEAKNESEIYIMLGKYMGYNMEYLPEYNINTLNEVLKYSGVDTSIEQLDMGPYAGEGCEIAFADRRFKTPSGKIELYCEDMEKRWGQSPLPGFYWQAGGSSYPLKFLSTHARERIHSQFFNIPGMDKNEKAVIYINEKDAARRSVATGDKLKVYNDKGSIFAYAFVCDFIREGVVNIYEGLPEKSGACVNILTSQDTSDIGYGAVYYDSFVEVEKCPE